MEIVWILLIVIFASLIKGITGFGFALIALPPLLFWYTPQEIIPVVLMCNLFASTLIVLQKKERKLVEKHFQTLIYYGAFFTIFGTFALKYVKGDTLVFIMSIFFILLSIITLVGVKYNIKQTKLNIKLAGALCGFLTGSISVSGPPMALFLNAVHVDNQQFREIFAWFNIVTASVAVFGFLMLDLLTQEILKMTFMFLPILYLGTFFGKRLNKYISENFFKKIAISMSLISSVFLLWKIL
ncbi:MAG: sulfite exporter TauE/SafE family protein [Bacteroidales bacterium]|nr:sulfite exporter TauE/SafE family protein [Bacteroidales bacterium]